MTELKLGMVFKQSFKYLKNGKIDFIKVILKLEFSIRIYIFYSILLYIRRPISTQTNAKMQILIFEFLFNFSKLQICCPLKN